MRHARLYSYSLGLGLLAAIAAPAAPLAGCAVACDEAFVECTTRPGLRYVTCGGSHYEFNDGASFDSEASALDYCYCSQETLPCDVAGVWLCNTSPIDGEAAVIYDNFTSAPIEEGVAGCRGWDACTLETTGCSHRGWYLRCTGEGDVFFVSSRASLLGSEAGAVQSCVVDGPGTCVDKIEECSEIDCASSTACWDGSSCRTFPTCFDNDSVVECTADPACQWEVR